MSPVPDYLVVRARPRIPFRVESLPLIAKMVEIGFHQYRSRWAKRLGKRAGRMIFDAAYGSGMGGQGTVRLELPGAPRRLEFDARKLHYASLYLDHYREGYEPEVAALLEALLTGTRVFYDVGANWGYFAFFAAAMPLYRGPIHAFEPVPETFADLADWVGQAGLEQRIVCHRTALSDRAGTGVMAVEAESSGLARLIGDGPGVDVPLACMDDMDLPPPDVLKIDVENHELAVLTGAESVLDARKPMVIFENWLDAGNREATIAPLRFMDEKGYRLFQPQWRMGDGTFFWPSPHRPLPAAKRDLAMIPFTPGDRFTLRDQVNVFACHRDRLDELADAFDTGP